VRAGNPRSIYFSTMKMEAAGSSETMAYKTNKFQKTQMFAATTVKTSNDNIRNNYEFICRIAFYRSSRLVHVWLLGNRFHNLRNALQLYFCVKKNLSKVFKDFIR
jgi:hypothetical protein